MFRTALGNLLKMEADFEVVGEASNGIEAVHKAKELNPDVILMDIRLPFLDGIAATEKIVRENSDAKILSLTSYEDEAYVVNIVKAGAKGYILKDSPVEELILAINTISKGSSYFGKEISSILFAHLDHSPEDTLDKEEARKNAITNRELEVLKYIAEEMTNKEIGAKLFISPRTVETHRRNLINKLKVKNTAGLVKFYLNCLMNQN
jgi:DNA-binding NarL/FixJ family response regulator